jgi:general secretion pathway protein I
LTQRSLSSLIHSRRRGKGAARPARGFSLLEVLVAFVILALVATALFRLFSASLNNASAAEDWSRALLLAESQLDIAASAQPLREGTDRGTDPSGRIQWETQVAPYAAPDVSPELETASDLLATRLFRVTTHVTFPGVAGGDRTLALATVKVGPRNPP